MQRLVPSTNTVVHMISTRVMLALNGLLRITCSLLRIIILTVVCLIRKQEPRRPNKPYRWRSQNSWEVQIWISCGLIRKLCIRNSWNGGVQPGITCSLTLRATDRNIYSSLSRQGRMTRRGSWRKGVWDRNWSHLDHSSPRLSLCRSESVCGRRYRTNLTDCYLITIKSSIVDFRSQVELECSCVLQIVPNY